MHAALLVILLSAPSQCRDCEIVVDSGFQSKVLQSEWNRETWPLKSLRYEIEQRYTVQFVDRLDSGYRGKYPAVLIENQSPRYLSFAASGAAITSLHEQLKEEAEIYARVMQQEHFEVLVGDIVGASKFTLWEEDGSPDEGPVIAMKPRTIEPEEEASE